MSSENVKIWLLPEIAVLAEPPPVRALGGGGISCLNRIRVEIGPVSVTTVVVMRTRMRWRWMTLTGGLRVLFLLMWPW